MTSRLKHKLELENVNLKSAYLNESFVLIGTPLPDLASTKKDKLEYVPEWQQEVRDEQGRRRFHGAFTGGFSAGYFNSVGSKEGWAPTEFKSSRTNRATRTQRAEDFMDDEDLQQMKDDRKLENTTTFQQIQQKQDVLDSLIRPNQSSIGEVLLSKLGWRKGQGIGPRISLHQLRKKQGKEFDPEDPARQHNFPPPDVKLVIYRAKEDHHGLGYARGHNLFGENFGEEGALGFILDPAGVPQDKWFAMPDVPDDWRPRPARVWGTTRKWDGEVAPVKEVVRGQALQPLSHEQRGAALGETRPVTVEIPSLSPRTASAALQGFMPYGDDLVKQDRYKSYLSSQTYNSKNPNPTLRLGSVEDINKELVDFAASARIFKPMSFAMSNRFTSGSTSLAATDLKQPKPGLHHFAPIIPAVEQPVEEAQPKTAKEHAAFTDNHGAATRTTGMFYPEKLLCKRFGVPNPHPDGEPKPEPPRTETWEITPDLPQEEGTRRPTSLGEVGMADDSEQGRDTLSYVKPSIDIFKAIFESDEVGERDDDEADDAEETVLSEIPEKAVESVKEEGPVDLATFKPIFKPRKESSGEKKKKDKKRKGVLSFDVGEAEERKKPKGDRSLAADFM